MEQEGWQTSSAGKRAQCSLFPMFQLFGVYRKTLDFWDLLLEKLAVICQDERGWSMRVKEDAPPGLLGCRTCLGLTAHLPQSR